MYNFADTSKEITSSDVLILALVLLLTGAK